MEYSKIIPVVELVDEASISLCEDYCNKGADELLIFDSSTDDLTHDKNIDIIKKISTKIDIQFMVYGNIKRLEDVKKYLYAGAKRAVLDMSNSSNIDLIKEASERFGKEKIALLFTENTDLEIVKNIDFSYASLIIADKSFDELKNMVKDIDFVSISNEDFNTYNLESSMEFSEFKTTTFGKQELVPVVVQDYKTNEVLMMAYMNKESFDLTIQTGRMTYYSRSRDEIWVKGLTSGHFQYLKELRCDCDNDTMLAKVFQVGAACHTGNTSCFFETIAKKEYQVNNPAELLNNVYNVILDRKANPKEGSYTNYLFDKGLDKILKKLGEEATEIVIAAKNPNPEEIKYEISDFLYHMLVLMAEKGVTWQEVLDELSRRG